MSKPWDWKPVKSAPPVRRQFLRRPRKWGTWFFLFAILTAIWWLYSSSRFAIPLGLDQEAEHKFRVNRFWAAVRAYYPRVGIPKFKHTRTVVIAAQKKTNIDWIHQELPDIEKAIYIADDASAPLHPPKNKGREAMIYLSYIIDNYESLPDVVLFFHSDRFTWHNNLLLNLDSVHMIRRLSTDRVIRQGYMNARCHQSPGCPDWLHFDRPKKDYDLKNKPEERFFTKELWHELHGSDAPIPDSLSQPCCAQFAASRTAIRRHPKRQYSHWRQWLLETRLEDYLAGRIFEYSWQYIFTGHGEFCPAMGACYCDGYGVCFQNEEHIQKWMSTQDTVEHLERQLWAIDQGQDEAPPEEQSRLKEDIERLGQWLNQTKIEAFERGVDTKNRVQ